MGDLAMPYPDNINLSALEAQAPRYLSSGADADLATLETLKRRVAALVEAVNAWTPNTTHGDDAHYALTNALDDMGMAIRAAEDGIAAAEGVRL